MDNILYCFYTSMYVINMCYFLLIILNYSGHFKNVVHAKQFVSLPSMHRDVNEKGDILSIYKNYLMITYHLKITWHVTWFYSLILTVFELYEKDQIRIISHDQETY